MKRGLRNLGITTAWIVGIAIWIGIIAGIGSCASALDGRTDCDRPVDCEVSPQDAGQPH